MDYCSIVDSSYILRAKALWRSFQEHCQPYRWWVLALDQRTLDTLEPLPNVAVVPLGDFAPDGIQLTPALEKARAELAWNVFIWACKPIWLMRIFDVVDLTRLVYIDSDCYFFSGPESVYQEIGNAPIALAPHRFSPGQEHFQVNGDFNGGFIYLRNLPQVRICLEAWSEACLQHQDGRHTEQRYLNTWPIQYGACVIKHKGVNLAPWNQSEQYTYTLKDGQIHVDADPLVFYHFHQGLAPAYPVDTFVRKHIYGRYCSVLEGIKK